MVYEEWVAHPQDVLLRDPNGVLRWVRLTLVIGPFDARSQVKYQWPESTIVEVRATPAGND